MKTSNNYGKCLEHPIELNSVPASIIFMNNLVTKQGYHIIFHRLGSMRYEERIIDHYEILSGDNQYDDIFINIDNERSKWMPPEGYLFDSFPESMCFQLIEREGLEELDPEDIIDFDEKYVFIDSPPNPCDFEVELDYIKSLPPLERVLLDSFGTNGCVEDFPYSLIKSLMNNFHELSSEQIEKILLAVKPRIID